MNSETLMFWGKEFSRAELVHLYTFLFKCRGKFYDNVPMSQAYGVCDDITDVLDLISYTIMMFPGE